jgi:hypothetical protein
VLEGTADTSIYSKFVASSYSFKPKIQIPQIIEKEPVAGTGGTLFMPM